MQHPGQSKIPRNGGGLLASLLSLYSWVFFIVGTSFSHIILEITLADRWLAGRPFLQARSARFPPGQRFKAMPTINLAASAGSTAGRQALGRRRRLVLGEIWAVRVSEVQREV